MAGAQYLNNNIYFILQQNDNLRKSMAAEEKVKDN